MKRMLLAVLACVILFSAGCQVVFDTPATEEYSETYQVSDGYKYLNLDNESGNVVVTGTETDEITVVYEKSCMGTNERDAEEHLNDINVTLSGSTADSTITITADFPLIEDAREYEAIFTITVPPDMILDLSANRGDITISNMTSSPKLETTRGKITITGFECDVEASATEGDIECTLDSLPPSSTVKLTTEDGYQTLIINDMDTSTVNSITMEATEKGKIDATLPSFAVLDFSLETETGEVRIEGYPDEDINYTEQGNKKKVGTIGEGTFSTITAKSAEGDVTLKSGE